VRRPSDAEDFYFSEGSKIDQANFRTELEGIEAAIAFIRRVVAEGDTEDEV
jgi:hypothetical protein